MDWCSFNWREKLEPERINSELTELKRCKGEIEGRAMNLEDAKLAF